MTKNFEWNELETLKDYGVQSITVEHPCNNLAITGDEFGALRIDSGPKYNIELSVDNIGLKRLQDAIAKEPRKPEDELKHELNVMHNVNACEGTSMNEKIDNYFKKVDSKAKVCDVKNKAVIAKYKIRHI